jgi:O-Antigen ligase
VSAVNESTAPGSDRALVLALALTAAAAVAWRGGYTEAGRGVVVLLAGAGLGLALRRRPAATAAALRSLPSLLLAALAALGALSAAWTVAAPSDALRWALVLVALAAVVGVAGAARAPIETATIMLLVAIAAAGTGVVGAIGHYHRIGLHVCGSWRPAGPFEYPPALALTCVMALPCAVRAMVQARGWRAPAGAGAGWFLAMTVAVAGSRLEVALAALALVAVAALPLAGERRAAAAFAATLVAGAGAVSALCVGGDLGDDPALALIAAGAVGVVVVGLWAVVRGRGERLRRGTWLAAVAVVGVAGVAASTAAERASGCEAEFAHGRSGIWAAAWATAQERPLIGHGLESFARASRSKQLRRRAVPVQYAHNLPLEAWVELGVPGVLLVLGLYGAVGVAVVRTRRSEALVLAPAAVAFLVANLFDWPWHLAGSAVLWAIAVGGLVGAGAVAGVRASGRRF